MSWSTEQIDELTKLWDQGLSASVIGKKLGVSKNAVVGKAHRLKLPARPSPIKRDGSATPRRRVLNIRPQVEPAPQAKSYTPPAQEKEPPRRIRAAEGTQRCLWPIGDPGDSNFHFCEAASVPGKPYCAEHCAKAYINKSRSETEAA
ncbi:MAG: GcrA family cell cycle regulator [Rhodovibrionaceae bacterium]